MPAAGSNSVSDFHALANGLGVHARRQAAKTGGWMSPNVGKLGGRLIYWGDYGNSAINVYSAKGVNGTQVGQITTGVSEPERLFVDTHGNVYATNIGNNTVTAYKPGQTTPFLTISNGVNSPTGLTVDAAGNVYCANVGNNTITVYPKGQTNPSLTISTTYYGSAEYLATDAQDNLYATTSGGVYEFASGSSNGTNLNLPSGAAGIEVDRKGNLIVAYQSFNEIEYFAPGQTQPSKTVSLSGLPFALSLSANEKQVMVSIIDGSQFAIEHVGYPKGSTANPKLSTNGGQWAFALSPGASLGK